MRRKLSSYLWISVLILGSSCVQAQVGPSDKNATKETANLLKNLKRLAPKGFLFGHQDDLAYGVNWKYEAGRSDVKEVTNDYPGIYGWELGGLEANQENDLDGVPFKKMKQYIRDGYSRGGVITISWHARSPFGAEKGAWDTTHGTVKSILPAGENHELFKTWLDNLAKFFGSLKGPGGEAIPILFRPWHELTGNWFWWCRNACTPFEFAALWRFTVYYLRDVKKLHNLLYVYNTSGDFKSKEEFLERYPGDEWVDVLSLDTYQYGDPTKDNWFVTNTNKALTIVADIAREKDMPFALAETGYEAIPYANWWTETLMSAIGENKISYVLVWRNHGYSEYMKKMHYYAPYKGQASEKDFIKFYDLGNTFFEKDVNAEKLYQ